MKNIFIITILVIVIASGVYFLRGGGEQQGVSVLSNDGGRVITEPEDILIEETEYFEDTIGYLARPRKAGQYPALILIHEWWGLTSDIKNIANQFAKEGYIALAVDMYDGAVTDDPAAARTLSSGVRDDVTGAFENLGAAVTYLKSRPDVDSNRVASVGWCFGGGWAYNMALNGLGINASVMYYGQFNPDDDFEMMRTDILGHFGEEDAAIAVDNVREFQAALETANGMHEVYIYPNVGHGFANIRDGNNLEYDEEAALVAWERTLSFLTSVLVQE